MSKYMLIWMLPAKEGDCLLIEYGTADNKKYVLIDGGRAWTYKHALKHKLEEMGIKQLELLVVSHVDRDHIDGVQKMLQDPDLNLTVNDIWFNTWAHLNDESVSADDETEDESFSVKMGEYFSRSILEREWPWNKSFNGKAVKTENATDPTTLSELNIQLLSPNTEKLTALKNTWVVECKKAGLVPGFGVDDYEVLEDDEESFSVLNLNALAKTPFDGDDSVPNGSSIAFILEYGNKRVLCAGDAHIDVLVDKLKALGASKASPIKLDAIKIPHHGSKGNVSKELLELIDCKHFLISTNGNYFKHPNDVAIARIIVFGTSELTLHFNYKTDHNKHWDKAYYKDRYGYRAEFPKQDMDGYCTLLLD